MNIASVFREQIAEIADRLSRVSEEKSRSRHREGGWSKKQILGHLIDSALNNHQRFVRASLEGKYEGPGYSQEAWVALHGYDAMPWSKLIEHWRHQNELLCEVVDRIPQERLSAPCQIENNAPVTLKFLIIDYLSHLQHHTDQIADPVPARPNSS